MFGGGAIGEVDAGGESFRVLEFRDDRAEGVMVAGRLECVGVVESDHRGHDDPALTSRVSVLRSSPCGHTTVAVEERITSVTRNIT